MNRHLLIIVFLFCFSYNSTSQSIVNTEKLFNDTEDGFATAFWGRRSRGG